MATHYVIGGTVDAHWLQRRSGPTFLILFLPFSKGGCWVDGRGPGQSHGVFKKYKGRPNEVNRERPSKPNPTFHWFSVSSAMVRYVCAVSLGKKNESQVGTSMPFYSRMFRHQAQLPEPSYKYYK